MAGGSISRAVAQVVLVVPSRLLVGGEGVRGGGGEGPRGSAHADDPADAPPRRGPGGGGEIEGGGGGRGGGGGGGVVRDDLVVGELLEHRGLGDAVVGGAGDAAGLEVLDDELEEPRRAVDEDVGLGVPERGDGALQVVLDEAHQHVVADEARARGVGRHLLAFERRQRRAVPLAADVQPHDAQREVGGGVGIGDRDR